MCTFILVLLLHVHGAPLGPTPPIGPIGPAGIRRDRGQATTEYALVLLAAALVALLVVAWATTGGGAEKIGQLFNRVIDGVIGRV